MRWDRLLADLEAIEAAHQRAEIMGEAAERTRLETARVSMESRLVGAVGLRLTIGIGRATQCTGQVDAVGRGWLALTDGAQSWLIATEHITWVGELPRAAAPMPEGAARKMYDGLGLAHVLRGMAADRSFVRLGIGDDEPLGGTIDRVGADFVDLAIHAPGEPRRVRDVRGQRTVPITAIRYARRGEGR